MSQDLLIDVVHDVVLAVAVVTVWCVFRGFRCTCCRGHRPDHTTHRRERPNSLVFAPFVVWILLLFVLTIRLVGWWNTQLRVQLCGRCGMPGGSTERGKEGHKCKLFK